MKVWERIKQLGGFYLSDTYGSRLTHAERFGYEKPLDVVKFVTIEELEKKYGRIIAVHDSCNDMDDECNLTIWTEEKVLSIGDYDGLEYFIVLPRNPPRNTEKIVSNGGDN